MPDTLVPPLTPKAGIQGVGLLPRTRAQPVNSTSGLSLLPVTCRAHAHTHTMGLLIPSWGLDRTQGQDQGFPTTNLF